MKSGTVPKIKGGRGGSRPGAGRPPKGGVPRWRLEEALGYSARTMGRIEEHVRLGEKFPFMAKWSRTMTLRVGKLLEDASPEVREFLIRRLESAK